MSQNNNVATGIPGWPGFPTPNQGHSGSHVKLQPRPDQVERVPEKIMAAMNFIAMCNQFTMMRGFVSEFDLEIREPELHVAQEQAFSMACLTVGQYFTPKNYKPEESKETP